MRIEETALSTLSVSGMCDSSELCAFPSAVSIALTSTCSIVAFNADPGVANTSVIFSVALRKSDSVPDSVMPFVHAYIAPSVATTSVVDGRSITDMTDGRTLFTCLYPAATDST